MTNIETLPPDLLHHAIIGGMLSASTQCMEYFSSEINDRDNIVVQSTAVIQYLGNAFATVLAARATALGHQGKFSDGLADAHRAIQCMPTSAEGYLVAGQLYSMQGKQRAAIDAYDKGLCYSDPSKWPLLYERRDQAKKLLEKRVDFAALVPTELVALIFNTVCIMDEDQLIECTLVSKTWRTVMKECKELWTNATIRYNHYMNPTAQLLPMVAHNVHKLHMELVREQRVHLLHTLAAQNMMCSVNTLVLMFQANDIATTDRYLSLVMCFQDQLKDLTIVVYSDVSEHRGSVVALDSILAGCSKLERLSISSVTTRIHYNSNSTALPMAANKYKLTALEVQVPDSASLLEVLIPQCPNLRFLSMTSRDPTILKLVDLSCLHLKHLKVCNDPCDDEATDEYKSDHSVGLRSIYYGNSRASRNTGVEHRVMQFFVNSQETLEHLTFSYRAFGISAKIQHQWFFLAHLGFNNLKFLQIHCQVEVVDLWAIVSAIVQRCFKLETVSFEMPGPVPGDFFMSFIQLPIRTLDLYSLNDRSCDSLIKLFDHHSSLGQRSTLQSVTLSRCGAITDPIFSALADIRTLHTVKLVGPVESFSPNQTKAFLHKLTGIPRLTNILLERIHHVELDSLNELEKVLGLKRTNYINSDEDACYVQLKK